MDGPKTKSMFRFVGQAKPANMIEIFNLKVASETDSGEHQNPSNW